MLNPSPPFTLVNLPYAVKIHLCRYLKWSGSVGKHSSPQDCYDKGPSRLAYKSQQEVGGTEGNNSRACLK